MNNKTKNCSYYFGYILGIIILLFIYSAVLMWLWNIVIVFVFGLPVISYWQAMGIYIISNILFKNSLSSDIKELNKND